MTPDPLCLGASATLREVVETMTSRRIRHVPIVSDQRHVLGMLGDHELRGAALRHQARFWNLSAGEVMSPALTIESNVPFGRALARLCQHNATALLVLEQGALVGILTRSDFLRALAGAFALNNDGSLVEVALDGTADLLTAFQVLHEQQARIDAVIAGRLRDDGGGAVLAVRLGTRNPRTVERALAQAALTLLVPEEELVAPDHADESC
jgi:acetoin utilization protein AcuB